MPDNQTATPPTKFTTNIAVDPRGFVRVDGVCLGQLLTEGDVLMFEVKDPFRARAEVRGRQFVRVKVHDLVRHLTE